MSTASSRILISLVFATVALAAASKQPLPPGFTVLNSTQQPGSGQSEMMSMPLVAPFFVEGGDYQSSITMVNETTKQVHGTVIARAGDGSELASKLLTFPAHSRTTLSLSDLLGSAPGKQITGSIELIPNPMEVHSMAIAAQLSIVGNRTMPPAYLEEEFISVDPSLPSQYRAVVPSAVARPTVALFSTSTSPQRAEVACLAENGSVMRRSVDLGAWQMVALPACTGREAFDGDKNEFESVFEAAKEKPMTVAIDVSTNAPPGSLAVWGVSSIGNRETKIALNFTNVNSLRSKETIFAGVPVGTADLLPGDSFTPDLAVANYGNKATTAIIRYSSMTGDSPQMQTVATVPLPAGAVQNVSLPNLHGDPLLRNSFVITSDADPGVVISNLILRGQEQYPVVQLIGKDPEVYNGGGHPWSIENGGESTLLLFNRSDKPQLFNVNIAVNGLNQTWHQEYSLQPSETKAILIGDLIRSKEKDLRGRILPASAQAGDISWFTFALGKGTGRLLVSNPQTALARNFSCGNYIVMCGSSLAVSTATFAVGGTGSLGPISANTCTAYAPSYCSGDSYGSGGGGASYYWTSLSTSIATISGSNANPSGTFLGQNPGTGTGQGEISNGTGCSFVSDGTLNVVKISINSAHLTSNQISTTLAPSGFTGAFSLWESNGSSTNYSQNAVNRGAGGYTDGFNLTTSTAIGQYSTIYATWTINGVQIMTSYNFNFYNYGNTRHSQYTLINESTCSGGAATAYIIVNQAACFSSGLLTTTLNSAFESQAALNGTGQSNSYGLLKALAASSCRSATTGKPSGADNGNSFVEVSSPVTGACNVGLSTSTTFQ